ncbi:hypothetical protein DFH11DRAFT_1726845 [Phellopilus nigrolimitatus]|nr:hypothetical protein DFH11DRAFT_1726845 [Phellopilus nigrolimitatus]
MNVTSHVTPPPGPFAPAPLPLCRSAAKSAPSVHPPPVAGGATACSQLSPAELPRVASSPDLHSACFICLPPAASLLPSPLQVSPGPLLPSAHSATPVAVSPPPTSPICTNPRVIQFC